MISEIRKQGYEVKFDDLPSDDQIVYVKRGNVTTVVDPIEEEEDHDHENILLKEEEKEESNSNPQIKSANEFCKRDDEHVKNDNAFEMRHKDANTMDKKAL